MAGLVAALERALSPGPIDDYWYQPVGVPAATGIRVDEQTALKVSVFWRCVQIVSGAMAKVPLHVYERLEGGGREIARGHPFERILRRPNDRQNGEQWRRQGQTHLLLRGNFYNRILPGSSIYPIGGLDPIHPDLVRVLRAEGGNPVYQVRDRITGATTTLDREQVWHVRGLSLDGVTGLDVISYAREGMGLTLGAEQFGARTLGKGLHFDKVFKHPGRISEEAAARLKLEAKRLYAGLDNVGEVAVLQEGMEVQQLTLTHEQAQLLATREFQARDVGRWVGVPPHMYGEITRNTSWGSGVEQMSIGFVMYVLLDWASIWEWAIDSDLLIGNVGDRHYTKFTLDGLLRGDTKARHAAYASGLQNRYYTRNEVRAFEDMNPAPGGDVFDAPRPAPGGGRAPAQAHVPRGFVEDAAARVVRKEQTAMTRAARRYEGDGAGWETAVRTFYANHPAYVSELLRASPQVAERYCREQAEVLLSDGPEAMDWTARAGDLMRMAPEE